MSGNMCEEVLMLINMFHKLPNRKYFLVSIMIIKAHFIYVPFLAYAEHHNFILVTLVTKLNKSDFHFNSQTIAYLFHLLPNNTPAHYVIVHHSLIW